MPFEYDRQGIARMEREIEARMIESGRRAVAVAQSLVHVDTGLLKSRISFTYDRGKRVLYLHADTPYAAIEEEGSIYHVAHPYLRPALNAIGDYWLGGTQIQYPSAIAKSNKQPNVAVVRKNRLITSQLHKGSSQFAHVQYRKGKTYKTSRFSPTRPDYWADPEGDGFEITPTL